MTHNALIQDIIAYADQCDAPETPFDTDIEGLSIVRSRRSHPFQAMLYVPLICLVLQGTKCSTLGEERVTFAAGESLIVSYGLPARSRIVEASHIKPYVAFALEIDEAIIRELRTDLPQGKAETPSRAMQVQRFHPELVDAFRRLFTLRDRPAERAVMEPMLRREIHYRVLQMHSAALLREIARPGSHAEQIAKAIATLKSDFHEIIRVETLAERVGMSPSSFHQHFKDQTATTPLQFQKRLRLLEGRRLIQDEDRPIGDAAFTVGYQSTAQFSRDYSREFGLSPSRDKSAAA